jgi:PAS domain S-box-containing protein
MLIADDKGTVIRGNAASVRMLGCNDLQELIGKPVMAFLVSARFSDWGEISCRVRECKTYGYSVLPSGQTAGSAPVDVLASLQVLDGKDCYVFYMIPSPEKPDNTPVVRFDAERLNLALQCTNLGTWDMNLRSGEMTVDARMAKMIGYTPADLAPLTFDGFMGYVHPDDRDALLELFYGWSKGKQPTGSVKMRLHHKSGAWVWVRSQWQVFWSPEADPVLRVVGVHQDITDMMKKDEAIHEAQKKIAMLSSVTRHDILNQVTVIRMLFDIMEMTGEVDPASDTWEQLTKINESALAIERQIVFTRDYEDLGSQPPAWQNIGEMVERVGHSSDEFSALTVTCTCQNIIVYADLMLERVVHELFTNAVLHGGNVTAVTVSCTTTPEGNAVITVSDDGVGIADGQKEKIFSRGVGMKTRYGLYLAREILSVTGITIRETGTAGAGAVFSLSVPRENWNISRNFTLSP